MMSRHIFQQTEPVVLSGFISDWEAAKWTPEILTEVFQERPIQFRIGKNSTDVQWESKCEYVKATIRDFNEWTEDDCCTDNPFSGFDRELYWCYADYKYMAELFKDQPQYLKAVDWSVFGTENRDGQQSTFWFGSKGSNTVCHYDTYGCNLVAQIYGRKQWILFPPADTKYLYPTRIPYEESSVFSQVSVKAPDLKCFPLFQHTTPYVVTLEPGDVLFVPAKWWHFVESLDTSISINSWIEMKSDVNERLREAVSRTMAFMLMSESDVPTGVWLNPTEEFTDRSQNLEYLRLALSAVETTSAERGKKRLRESSPSAELEESTHSKKIREQGGTCSHSPSVISEKLCDIAVRLPVCDNRIEKVNSFSWEEYCQLINIETTAESKFRSQEESDDQNPATECNTETECGSCSTDIPSHNHSKNSSDSASSSTDVGVGSVTMFDLADVFLDPEVINLMCQKLLVKFRVSQFDFAT